MLIHPLPKYSLVSMTFYEGKVYIPRSVMIEGGGGTLNFEPVLVTRINSTEIAEAVEQIHNLEEMTIPFPKSKEEFTAYPDVLLRATKARSWKMLARKGMYADIVWIYNEIRMDISKTDKKGFWGIDPDKQWAYPTDTPLTAIIDVILQDYQSRNFPFPENQKVL